MQVSENEADGLSGLSEQDRLAAERAIACQLLPVTYDGSPLVRAELAAALARFASGHVVLFKVNNTSLYTNVKLHDFHYTTFRKNNNYMSMYCNLYFLPLYFSNATFPFQDLQCYSMVLHIESDMMTCTLCSTYA